MQIWLMLPSALWKSGSSFRIAFSKYILVNTKVVDEKKAAVKHAIRKLLAAETIIQIKLTFKLVKVEKPKKEGCHKNSC